MLDLQNIQISRANESDARELAEFAARTFEEAFASQNNPDDLQAHLASNYGVKQQSAELRDPQVVSILARREGKLLAYAQVRRKSHPPCVTQPKPVELHRFYVDQEAHGSGLAGLMMEEVRNAASEMRGQSLWLGVWERNPRAIRFYEKCGFSDVGSHVYQVGSEPQKDRVLITDIAMKDWR